MSKFLDEIIGATLYARHEGVTDAEFKAKIIKDYKIEIETETYIDPKILNENFFEKKGG